MREKEIHEKSAEIDQSLFEDEALEAMWEIRERKSEVEFNELVEELRDEERLLRMKERGLVTVEGGKVSFTDEGKRRARDITRRHRLAERLFFDVLDLKNFELEACRLEHAISPDVEEAICTLLGHPPTCPHGKPIPRGECCKLYTRKVTPLVQSLKDTEVGKTAKVLFITVPSMDRLATMGLVPGAVVRLVQRIPSYVVEIEETTIAIDEDIAKGIFVKPV